MYIKLNFTQAQNINQTMKVVAHIIQNSSITDIDSFNTISASWASATPASAKVNLATSEIYRTEDPNNVLVTFRRSYASTSGTYNNHNSINFRFNVYDDPTEQYWVSLDRGFGVNNSTPQTRWVVSDGTSQLVAGNMTETIGPTQGSTTAYYGSFNGYNGATQYGWNGNADTITSIHVYVTNTCLIWATTHQDIVPTGFGTTYNNQTYYTGPNIFSQYTRYDHWNTAANGIIPLAWTDISYNYAGFRHVDFNRSNLRDTNTVAAFRAYNFPDVIPKVGATYTMQTNAKCHWGSGVLFNDFMSLQTPVYAATGNSTADYYDPSYGSLVQFNDHYRYPSADLKDLGFAMHPMQIRNSIYNFGGGNMSDQSGFYLFNGDYAPGDDFVYNSKTYTILPTRDGYTSRVGIAIPKE